jgi:carbon-monoxide dehydrogenase small subunit
MTTDMITADETFTRLKMSARSVSITVNGQLREGHCEPRQLLSDFLHDNLGIRSVKVSCDIGICGACTIMLGGRTVRACLMFAIQANGKDILTIEGLSTGPNLHPLQEAFWDSHALQCGYCTPGMLISAHQLLLDNDDPSESEIRAALDGNLCRCTGYVHIVEAISLAAKRMKSERTKPAT